MHTLVRPSSTTSSYSILAIISIRGGGTLHTYIIYIYIYIYIMHTYILASIHT